MSGMLVRTGRQRICPVNPGDTATFNTSTITTPTFFNVVTIESVTFNADADAFTIQNGGNTFTLQGAGVVNNSGRVQTINNLALDGTGNLIFANAATAGNSLTINNAGAGTSTQFQGNSSAGNATITNSGAGSFTLFGATTEEGSRVTGRKRCKCNDHKYRGKFVHRF